MLRDELVKQLDKIGHALRVKDSNAGPLRDMQRFLWDWEDRSDADNDEDFRFVIFFLNVFIDKIFYNLIGEVPFKDGVTKDIQTTFYEKVGNSFCVLSKQLQERNLPECYQCYVRLGVAYLDAVDSFNEKL